MRRILLSDVKNSHILAAFSNPPDHLYKKISAEYPRY